LVLQKSSMIPPLLAPGSKGAVFSPSGAVSYQKFQKNFFLLESWGLDIEISPECFRKCRYLAGSDHERTWHLISLLEEGYDFLWAARGGYGALRLLHLLDEYLEDIKRPFWLIGFSDVSILLNYFTTRFELTTLHAPVITSLCETNIWALAALKNLLFSGKEIFLTGQSWQRGKTKGLLLGGNLVSLVSLLGSKWFPDLSGKILFLEEINEDLYRIDRLLTQLYHAGVFAEISGLALGEFKGVNLEELKEIICEYYDGPTVAELPVGHGSNNFPILIGGETWLESQEGRAFLYQKLF